MAKRAFLFLWFFVELFSFGGPRSRAQSDASSIRVNVVLVQLNVAVTDRKGNYVSGLRPQDFEITEDKIPEKIATFEEGNEPTRRLIGGDSTTAQSMPPNYRRLGQTHWNADSGCQCLHSLRYQQLHVWRVRFRAGRHRRLCSLSRRSQQRGALLVQPQPLPRRHPHSRPLTGLACRTQHCRRRFYRTL